MGRKGLVRVMAGFDPNQPRDEIGRWTEAGIAARKAAFGINDADYLVENISQKEIEGLNLPYDEEFSLFSLEDREIYQIKLEGWFPDCMESRGLGKTTEANIRRNFKRIMQREAGWDDIVASGYMSDRRDAEFGVTYIVRKNSNV